MSEPARIEEPMQWRERIERWDRYGIPKEFCNNQPNEYPGYFCKLEKGHVGNCCCAWELTL